MKTIYDFTAKNNKGKDMDFTQFKGKVLLIINTASKCGFTPQYKGLEELYKKYKDQGLAVIGFPCDQFGHQEPGSNEEIASFCEMNYGVSFPIMEKIEVNGKNASPIFKYLKSKAGGLFGSRIKWNFTKFLISRDGQTIKRFSPIKNPKSLEKYIEKMLNK
ncbi:MAG: glutathione peroxidase [Dysgonomonas sp.]|jgi:glutathione peroxidase|uniref:glutathione peroxidase n=1 Tax=unclassified Dysgonomonas TaxID=2630389 RepID=UPI0025C3D72C|nr:MULTISPECIES: glutathione peroxidase [unclassified Dysgonomonas]MDR1715844.1 glutathione peroxidase [Prevotella sp.]MDR2002564.1 glutathione peroxidase [Prevotella sp.]HMM01921.1 glutathione peroxidase [Dysgonomonas sp.]